MVCERTERSPLRADARRFLLRRGVSRAGLAKALLEVLDTLPQSLAEARQLRPAEQDQDDETDDQDFRSADVGHGESSCGSAPLERRGFDLSDARRAPG